MIKNKRGSIPVFVLKIFLVVGLVIVGIIVLQNVKFKFGDSTSLKNIEYKPLGDIITETYDGDWSALNFFSYIAGGVPQFLINEVGGISAAIVIFALFVMFVFTFGDIISSFGLFSKTTAWVIGGVLSIVIANLKLIMMIAIWSFGIIGGIGVLSIAVGIAVPFIIFLVLNIFLGAQLRHLGVKKEIEKESLNVEKGAGAVENAITAFRKAARSFGKELKD
jgi:hypothetical protein